MARFVTITPDMSEAVIQHLRDNFFADEPLNKAVSLCERGQPHAALEGLCAATMADGLSIAAMEGDTVSSRWRWCFYDHLKIWIFLTTLYPASVRNDTLLFNRARLSFVLIFIFASQGFYENSKHLPKDTLICTALHSSLQYYIVIKILTNVFVAFYMVKISVTTSRRNSDHIIYYNHSTVRNHGMAKHDKF